MRAYGTKTFEKHRLFKRTCDIPHSLFVPQTGSFRLRNRINPFWEKIGVLSGVQPSPVKETGSRLRLSPVPHEL